MRGHEQAGVRPALVLSPEVINRYYNTVMVAAITSSPQEGDIPIEVTIQAPEGGLTRDSRIMLLQTRFIDKSRIIGRYGNVSEDTMAKVDAVLRIVSGLSRV